MNYKRCCSTLGQWKECVCSPSELDKALPCPALPGSEVKLTGPRARTPLIAFIPGDWTVNGAAHTSTDC